MLNTGGIEPPKNYEEKSKVKKILLSPNHVKTPFYLAGAFAKASRKQNLKKTILIISDM